MRNRSPRHHIAVLAGIVSIALASPAAAQLACPGNNLLTDIKANKPEVYDDIRKAADATKNAKHLLWKIEPATASEKPPSYLFGTMHVTDDRIVRMPPGATAAMRNSRRVALEVEDMSPQRFAEALGVMQKHVLLPNNDKMDKHLTPGEVEKLKVILAKQGLKGDGALRLRPWVAQLAMAVSQCERSRIINGRLPLDSEIARKAEDSGLGVMGLETIETQIEALALVPDEKQTEVLKAGLALYDRMDDMMETLIQLYLSRDLGAIWPLQMALARSAGATPEAYAAFADSLIVKRNLKMRDRALAHLGVGGIFIAVGALHLPGEHGLVALLEDAGYKVTPIE
jgi:hypothetical protein